MKILHVFPFFSLKFAGGTADFIYKLAGAQFRQGHEVTVYTGGYKIDEEYAKSLKGVRIVSFRSWFNFGFYLMPGLIDEARNNLKNFDILHLHCYRSFQNMIIHHYAKKYNVPYVLDAHGSIPRFSRKRRVKKLFDFIYGYKIVRDASRLIAETAKGASEYDKLGIGSVDVTLFSPPFDTEEFSSLPMPKEFINKFSLSNKRLIVYLGRINYIKGLDFLIESFSELSKLRNDLILIMVGSDDGYKKTLEALIAKLKLKDKVLFLGFVSKEDKLRVLVDADVVVQVSRYEEGAWAPLEATLCNRPIIVTSHTGAGEDVKRIDAGYLVEFGNKEDLCDKIQFVLNNQDDAIKKAKKAKAYIESNMSMKYRIVEYDILYNACIKEKKV